MFEKKLSEIKIEERTSSPITTEAYTFTVNGSSHINEHLFVRLHASMISISLPSSMSVDIKLYARRRRNA